MISGGGTGGHLYPAIAIAEALKKLDSSIEILFVGALGKLEMEKVPQLGYSIIGLDIRGFNRSFSWENLKFPYRLLKSYLMSRKILKDFKPQLTIGVGGYASGPLLWAAGQIGIPTLIQEQNSYPGRTNLLLAKKAKVISVAYLGMDQFFEASKIKLTGNPIRNSFLNSPISKPHAIKEFGLVTDLPILLILGGSGGAKVINESILNGLDKIEQSKIQIIWQTGAAYYERILLKVKEFLKGEINPAWKIIPFLDQIQSAYSASDLIISRAGAGTISEISLMGKPVILVPSPNVAEDHQTKNAKALVQRNAAILVPDSEAFEKVIPKALELIKNEEAKKQLSKNILSLSYPHASEEIAQIILDLAGVPGSNLILNSKL